MGTLWAVVSFTPDEAHAQSSVDLAWNAPPECPQEGAVRERLQALTGAATQGHRRLHAEGRIERVGKRYRLTLSVREGDAVRGRTMNADSCNDLASAAAVALGLLIRSEPSVANGEEHAGGTRGTTGQGTEAAAGGSDATGTGGTAGTTGASADHAGKPSSAVAATASKNKEPPAKNENTHTEDKAASSGINSNTTTSERHWRLLLRAPVGVLSLGRLPKPSGGVAAGVGASYDEWRINIVARIFASQTLESNNAYEAGARVGRRDLALGACRDWRSGRLALAPCLVLAVQRETAEGSGPGVTPQPQSAISMVIGAAGEAHVFAFDWVSLVTNVAVGVETSRLTLQVTPVGDVKKLGPIDVSFSVGAEWIF
jgi:hypothetical protein